MAETPSIAALLRDNRFAAVTSAAFALQDVQLRWLKGSERLGEPFRYEAKIASGAPIRNFARIPGQEVTIGFKIRDGGTRFIHGLVTRLDYLGLDDTRRPHYALQLRPWLALLEQRRNSRIFQNRTSLEIVTTLFREHRGSFRDRTTVRPPRRPYCVQHDETDLAFVSRLLEQDGIYYYFEHAEGRHELVLVDNAASHPAARPDTVETHLNLEKFRYLDDILWHWQESAELVPARVVLDDYDEEKPAATLLALAPVAPARTGGIPLLTSTAAPAPRQGSGGRIGTAEGATLPGGGAPLSEVFTNPGRYRERRDGEFYAAIRAEEIACRAYRVRLQGNARQVTTGSVFKAANPFDIADRAMAPAPSEAFLAIATEIEVIGDLGEAPEGGGLPQLYRSTIEALPAGTQFRPPLRTPRPVAGGPQSALVVGRPGETITTDRLGRVRLQFLWDREGRRDENSSCWVRVAQSWAGRGFGALVTPRIGQEAVVSFLDGDFDRPVVTGLVYNGANPPPESLPDRATRSSFRTRSHGGGQAEAHNLLRFEDRAGAESVHLRAQRNHTQDVQRLFFLNAGKSATVSAEEGVLLESTARSGPPAGSHIDITPEGIALRVSGPRGEQCLVIGADGITLQGRGIRLISAGELLVSSPPLPLIPQLARVATAALKRDSLEAKLRHDADAREAARDQE